MNIRIRLYESIDCIELKIYTSKEADFKIALIFNSLIDFMLFKRK